MVSANQESVTPAWLKTIAGFEYDEIAQDDREKLGLNYSRFDFNGLGNSATLPSPIPLGHFFPAMIATRETADTVGPGANLFDDILRLFSRPSHLFASLPERSRVGGALFVLLVAQLLYAAAIVSTGVYEFEIKRASRHAVTKYILEHEGDDEEGEVTPALDAIEKGAVFEKLLKRVTLFVVGPVQLLARVSVLCGILFAVVAVRGGKPNFSILAGVCVFASLVDVPKLMSELFLVSQLQVSRVETSAAAFVRHPDIAFPIFLLLRRLDPFELWFWYLIGLGTWKSGALTGRAAIVVTALLASAAAAGHVALDVVALGDLAALQETPPTAK